MIVVSDGIEIQNVRSGRLISAIAVELSAHDTARIWRIWKKHIEVWTETMCERVPVSDWPEHIYWNWQDIGVVIQGNPRFELCGVMTGTRRNMICQGLVLMTLTGHRSRIDGSSIVYFDRLATAPWNGPRMRLPGQRDPMAGVGRALVKIAISTSHKAGYNGIIGLHSLPKAEDFYRKLGLVDLGVDTEFENLRYFESSNHEPE